jgi:hypothetical protein
MKSKDQQVQSKKALNTDSVGCELSRRQFLGGCAACAAGLAGISALSAIPVLAQPPASNEKTKVRLVFTHIPPQTPTWPNIGYDYEGRKKELIEKLSKGCPGIEFLPATVQNQDEAKKLLEADKEVDGYLVYMIGIWTGGPQIIAASGRPTIFVDDLYGGSGEFLVAYSAAKRQGLKVAGVSSTKFDDVIQAAKCFECIKKLQSSVILRLGGGFGCSAKGVQDVFGTKVVEINYDPLNELYNKADKDEARKCAQRWTKQAEKIVEPSHQEIEKSAAMYLAMRELMNQNKARAITINCLGGFYGGHITAYPCLGFFQFNNDGFVGACEGDLTSTISMLLMGYLVGRPGYISDPVIDTSKNQIIYAHCVAPNKVFGPNGPTNAYHIRSHSEDRKGACVRSLMPLGEMTTTLEFNPDSRKVIIHQGKSVANIDEDKACRTKLAAEPKGDINKLLNFWDQWGWHRVTFYGDLKRPVEHISALLGFEVIEEA